MQEKHVKMLEKEITPFVQKAKNISVTSPKDMEEATSVLSTINKYSKQVKESKETVTKPLNEALKAARALFAPLEDSLDTSLSSIRVAMSTYQTEQKRIADEEAAKIQARVGEGKGKLKFETAVQKIDEIEKPTTNVKTSAGSVKFITIKKFEVTDISLIPKEYLLPNEVMIRKAMQAGIELPGVRYFEEQSVRNTL